VALGTEHTGQGTRTRVVEPGGDAVHVELDREARVVLAERLDLTEEDQLALARDPSEGVRSALAENTSVGAAAQLVLARDAHWRPRTLLALNPAVTREAQLVLAGDTSATVRHHLALNEALELDGFFPLVLLLGTKRGREFTAREVERAGADPEVLESLRHGWSGSFEELLAAAQELKGG
jgi:hypothetical protein